LLLLATAETNRGLRDRFEAVSIPAVAKLITALERELGARLFDRTFRGLTLTDGGQRYLEGRRSLIDQLHAADGAIGGAASRLRSTVTIGTRESIAQHCILPALPRFRARYPDIQIDL
jgi:DNA-binding transcriptional LysR family regulator